MKNPLKESLPSSWIWPSITAAIFVSILIAALLVDRSSAERIEALAGPAGPVVLAGMMLSTQVLAPLSGIPFLLVAIKLYGYTSAMLLYYLVCLVAAALNFAIGRHLGRRVVRRLVGANAMAKVDAVVRSNERTLLIISRLFGWFVFDLVSYAGGLSAVPFKRYYAYSATVSLLPFAVQYFALKHLDVFSTSGLVLFFAFIGVATITLSWILFRKSLSLNPSRLRD